MTSERILVITIRGINVGLVLLRGEIAPFILGGIGKAKKETEPDC